MATPTNLPASFTAGQVLTAAQQNALRGAFRVLQVVYGTTATQQAGGTSTLVDTGLTATITPQSSTSTILVLVSQNGVHKSTSNTGCRIVLLRGATNIGEIAASAGNTGSTTTIDVGTVGTMLLDSPATVSATTYKTQYASTANTAFAAVQLNSARSTMVLMEISA